MDRLYFDNLRLKIRFWVEFRNKNIDFVEGYLQANWNDINQSEHNRLLKYAKTLTYRNK